MTRTATKVYPKSIQLGQQVRIAFMGWGASGRRRFEWRTVALVEQDRNEYVITYLEVDGSYRVHNRLRVAANSKHEVRG